ncbi:MAG: His/Gly/Thr/Pro-type tRNA ligase C-terminal domain-containing protein [Candidatus Nanohalobium sp.]
MILASDEDKAREKAEEVYHELSQDEEVLFYDGEMSVGEKFAEADLIGVQRKVIVGNTFLEDGEIEVEDRSGKTELVEEVVN